MDWLKALATLISIVSVITEYLKNKQLIDAGKAEAVSVNLKGALDAISDAAKTKMDVDSRTSGPDASQRLSDDAANLYRD